jgi:AraC-like DNA-binding protein
MSPKRQGVRRAISASLGEDSGFALHSHPAHQLAWTSGAGLRVGVEGTTWMLSERAALWIPAGVEHDVVAERPALLRSLYFLPGSCPVRWRRPTPVVADGLARELLEHLLGDVAGAPRRRAERVLFDLLRPLSSVTLRVPWPSDDRAVRVADALDLDPADGRTLAEWGRVAGASGRTLARAFERETGMGFAEWRTHLRIAHAARRLVAGERVGRVGASVGYATSSAFVAAFRRVVGITPGAYSSNPRHGEEPSREPSSLPVRTVARGVRADVQGDVVFA